MRIAFILFLLCLALAISSWMFFSGIGFVFISFATLVFVVITWGYSDSAILFFLGAREVKSIEESKFHGASIQEAYKLAVPRPQLYSYNGSLDRAFVIQNGQRVSLVVAREVLDSCSQDELSAICFELLLQVKKNMASKRTKAMYLIGALTWGGQLIINSLSKLIPLKEFKVSLYWLAHYLSKPWLDMLFKFTIGEKFFVKLEKHLRDYPRENELLMNVGGKINRVAELNSFSSRKIIEFSTLNRSSQYQCIMAIEFLPHEWDMLFSLQPVNRA